MEQRIKNQSEECLDLVFERVVFGGGNTDEVLEDCGLLETDEEITTEAVEPTG